jgi:predicted MPP superfamily phosphohydrolase
MRLAEGWRLREFSLELLPEGANPFRILHISDIHIAPNQNRKRDWVRSLAELEPDLVVNTGDNLSAPDAVGLALNALEPLLNFPGVFVWGSNDYFAPSARNPINYLLGPSNRRPSPKRGETDIERLRAGLISGGWLDLNNQSGALEVAGNRLGFLGLNDPHENLADFDSLPAQAKQLTDTDLVIGVAHAPYLAVIEAMTENGSSLTLCGHTHGGQVCLPGGRALVTNCDLPTKYARGLSAWQFGERQSLLHVSAGIGTSVYAQYRLFCPPEASLITVLPRS